MKTIRTLLLATALLASGPLAGAQAGDDRFAPPVLRANVTVTSDLVRIGDLVENAGVAAQIPVYRAPDLGTTGTIATAQVIATLRANSVIGVEARNVREVTVTRLARTVLGKDIELAVARALEHRAGLGDAASLSLTFDRDIQDVRLDASNSGEMQAIAARYEPRTNRFDVTFEIANDSGTGATKLRFTGTAVEMVETAVLTRAVDRGETLTSADLVMERRTRAEAGSDATTRDRALGMQIRRPMRAGQPVRTADLIKPDLVQRDQAVTVIYEAPGLYLTTRGKALESGTEGDIVTVQNLQSKRTMTGVVSGRGQVLIQAVPAKPAPDVTSSIAPPPGAGQPALAETTETGSSDRTPGPQARAQLATQVATQIATTAPKAE